MGASIALTFVRIDPRAAISDSDARPHMPRSVAVAGLRKSNEFPTMLLDSNSRSILGCCVVAVVLLLTWFHGNGRGLDSALSRCEQKPVTVDDARDCATCHQQGASRSDVIVISDARQAPVRIVSTAPRS